jgi:hypothetical protein
MKKAIGLYLIGILGFGLCMPVSAEVTTRPAEYHQPVECKIVINNEPIEACTDFYITRGESNVNFHLDYGGVQTGYSFVALGVTGAQNYQVTHLWVRKSSDEQGATEIEGKCVLQANTLNCNATNSSVKISASVKW